MYLDSNKIITIHHRPIDFDLSAGALILINKPLDWTSFDVVNKVRHAIRHHLVVKKFKVGHSGTLDPMATGLLLICIGKYTKELTQLTSANKAYSGTIKLGATTPSYDAESDEDAQYPTEHIDEKQVLEASSSFVGGYDQVPPMFSAIKVKGQKMYDLARRGGSIELEPRPIMIDEFNILSFEGNQVRFYCACGKGTYIRSLAYDFGKKLESGAYLTSLQRESIEEYQLADALNVDECVAWVRSVILG